MKFPKRDLSITRLKRLSIPKALALIQEHYGYGRMTAERFYDFLMHGEYKTLAKRKSPRKTLKRKPAKTAA
jgi:hypothetical protein